MSLTKRLTSPYRLFKFPNVHSPTPHGYLSSFPEATPTGSQLSQDKDELPLKALQLEIAGHRYQRPTRLQHR